MSYYCRTKWAISRLSFAKLLRQMHRYFLHLIARSHLLICADGYHGAFENKQRWWTPTTVKGTSRMVPHQIGTPNFQCRLFPVMVLPGKAKGHGGSNISLKEPSILDWRIILPINWGYRWKKAKQGEPKALCLPSYTKLVSSQIG